MNNIVLCKIKRKPLNKKSSCVLVASTTISAPPTFIQPIAQQPVPVPVHAPTQQQPAANFYGCSPDATFQFGAPNLPFAGNCGVPYGNRGGGGGVQQQQQQQQEQQQSVYVTTSTVGDYVDTIGGGAGEIIGRMDWDKDFGYDDDTEAATTVAQLQSANVEDHNLVEDDSWTEYINRIDDSLAQHQTTPHNNNNNNNYCYSESSPNKMMNNGRGSLDQPQQQQQPSVEGSYDDDDELIA